jgi:hypothetical protein
MSSTRPALRTTSNSKTTSLNAHHTNGLGNSYDINDSTSNLNYPTGNTSELDFVFKYKTIDHLFHLDMIQIFNDQL